MTHAYLARGNRHAAQLQTAAGILGKASVLVGGAVLLGWILDIASLKSVWPGLVSMKVNTAIAFILAGSAFWTGWKPAPRTGMRRISLGLAVLVQLIGGLTLIQFLAGWDSGIDQALMRDAPQAAYTTPPGRMSPTTAVNFMLTGAALALMPTRSYRAAQVLSLIAFCISFVALAGYIFGVDALYRVSIYSSMAVHTALTFMLLSTGVLLAYPERGMFRTLAAAGLAGDLTRWLVSITFGVPMLLGAAIVFGQKQGLYDAEFGMAVFTVCSTLLLTMLVLCSTELLDRAERRRLSAEQRSLSAEQACRAAELRYAVMSDFVPEMHALVDSATGEILDCNRALACQLGYEKEYLLGHSVLDLYAPDCRAQAQALHLELASRGDQRGAALVLRRRSGTVLDVTLDATALLDEHGKIIGNRLVWTDITPRKQAEEALRAARCQEASN